MKAHFYIGFFEKMDDNAAPQHAVTVKLVRFDTAEQDLLCRHPVSSLIFYISMTT